MSLYITREYEFVEELPENKLAEVLMESGSYNGNKTTEYTFQPHLTINDWNLCSISINRQWNESHIIKIMVNRPTMSLINLRESIHASGYISEIKWLNNRNTELGLNSQILRKVIAFIKTIPFELLSKRAIELYFQGLSDNNMTQLSKFYQNFVNSREQISESDIKFLEKFYLDKMNMLMSGTC